MIALRQHFNLHSVKTKGLTLLIEHGPCCILSFSAGLIGLPGLNHNPVLELGFALGGAVVGEFAGSRLFHKHAHAHEAMGRTLRRYGLSLLFGVASWGVHQKFMHQDHDHAHPAQETHRHTESCVHDGHKHAAQYLTKSLTPAG